MSFKKCPHTCSHDLTGRSSKTAIQSNFIFYTPGSSFRDHMSSKMHPNCTSSCNAHKSNPNRQEFSIPTDNDWKEVAQVIYRRFSKNPQAIALIPVQYLTQQPSSSPDPEIKSNNDLHEQNDEPVNQQETQVEKELEDEWPNQQDDPPSFHPTHRHLVEHAISPFQTSESPTNPPSSFISETHPSPIPSSSSESLTEFTTAWINPTHFDRTSFYTDPLKVVFVDLPVHHASKSETLSAGSGLYRVSIRLFLYTISQSFSNFLASFERYYSIY
jgi:hypothetical protein